MEIKELYRECYVCFGHFRPEDNPGDYRCPYCKRNDEYYEFLDYLEWLRESAAEEEVCRAIKAGKMKFIPHEDGTGHFERAGE